MSDIVPIGFLRVNPRELDPLVHRGWGEEGGRPLRKVILVRENAPAGFDACRCVILISRTRRRNARPYPRSFRKVDVLMMSTVRPALGTFLDRFRDSTPPRQDPAALPPLYCFGTVNYCVSFTRVIYTIYCERIENNNFFPICSRIGRVYFGLWIWWIPSLTVVPSLDIEFHLLSETSSPGKLFVLLVNSVGSWYIEVKVC